MSTLIEEVTDEPTNTPDTPETGGDLNVNGDATAGGETESTTTTVTDPDPNPTEDETKVDPKPPVINQSDLLPTDPLLVRYAKITELFTSFFKRMIYIRAG